MIDEELKSPFLTEEKFSILVEERAIETGETLLSTILELLDEYDIEESEAKNFISRTLKQKLEVECRAEGLLVKDDVGSLDFFFKD